MFFTQASRSSIGGGALFPMLSLATSPSCCDSVHEFCHEVGLATVLSRNLAVVPSSGCTSSVLDHTEIINVYFRHCNTQEDVLRMHVLCAVYPLLDFVPTFAPIHVCHDC